MRHLPFFLLIVGILFLLADCKNEQQTTYQKLRDYSDMAYTRSLDYEDVPYQTAKKLFNRPLEALTQEEAKKLDRDF